MMGAAMHGTPQMATAMNAHPTGNGIALVQAFLPLTTDFIDP
jgi:hypothetical protein